MVFHANISEIDIIIAVGLYLRSSCRLTEGDVEDTIN